MGQKVSPWTVIAVIAAIAVIIGFFYMKGSGSSIPEDERAAAQRAVSGQAATLPMKGGGVSPIPAMRGGAAPNRTTPAPTR